MASKGHDKITPDGKKIFKQIEELKKMQVRVGYQKGAAAENGVDILDIAVWNELGTARAPARPFIRQSADMNKGTIEKFCAAQLKKVTQGGTAEQALNAIGVMQKGLIQDTISKSKEWADPNAPATVERKGSEQPLVDTGRLRQSASYVIVPKGGGD
ncbi:MAG: hypothetical protein LBU13_07650 [Synergistaceae bacterium]|jgi:hypothetical protein|nr:hypothetical protein [Synergistaceae bacterium]